MFNRIYFLIYQNSCSACFHSMSWWFHSFEIEFFGVFLFVCSLFVVDSCFNLYIVVLFFILNVSLFGPTSSVILLTMSGLSCTSNVFNLSTKLVNSFYNSSRMKLSGIITISKWNEELPLKSSLFMLTSASEYFCDS